MGKLRVPADLLRLRGATGRLASLTAFDIAAPMVVADFKLQKRSAAPIVRGGAGKPA